MIGVIVDPSEEWVIREVLETIARVRARCLDLSGAQAVSWFRRWRFHSSQIVPEYSRMPVFLPESYSDITFDCSLDIQFPKNS